MLEVVPVLRLTLDDQVVDALTDADDLEAIRARLVRTPRHERISETTRTRTIKIH
ncbi:hypothetical protein [Frankia nepalensis]|uniref:Uncharacterized protein n=1 Tax=Frankia nepalensis TaxID=1836974 RepID=A0A937RS02_9ACTN|nr:hypothetical protein [Frankia nepalensis]MBL7502817.1 hypothetical protein [Frankia nepalensis]MBL7515272.1 hypothetical protein [Frankia nepalensis]MBL7632289.1 hypothetical protein [Frankia nepalensis]